MQDDIKVALSSMTGEDMDDYEGIDVDSPGLRYNNLDHDEVPKPCQLYTSNLRILCLSLTSVRTKVTPLPNSRKPETPPKFAQLMAASKASAHKPLIVMQPSNPPWW